MADPLITPAVVGFVVTKLLTDVMESAKGAYYCKDECKLLVAKLENIQPLVTEIDQNAIKGNAACTKWLRDFEGLLERARDVTNECLGESRVDKARRVLKFWRWKKLPSRVRKINSQIEEARANTSLVTLGCVLQLRNPPNPVIALNPIDPPKVTGLIGFEKQDIPSLIVGVGNQFDKLKTSILESHSKDKASCFGLQGRGGAGKTLLAQRLNDDDGIRKMYGEDSMIWITVGREARVVDLYEKLGKSRILDNGLLERLKSIRNQEEQRTCLKNAFADKKVFWILDDVWDEQYDHHEMMYWLDIAKGPGSTTLITSRSNSVLCRAHAEVEVLSSLPENDSWELFCFYAFARGTCPTTIPENLARDVCEECKGLPLALRVIGSAMLDKMTEEEWRSALFDLQQSKPILDSNVDEELFGRLQLSYNGLKHDETKICFLYFASYPEDYEISISELFSMWTAEGLFGMELDAKQAKCKARVHLEILVKRSLIDWNREEEYVQVHDILRDLALYIIDNAKFGDCAHECYFQSGKVSTSFPRREILQELKRMSFSNCNISKWIENLETPHLKVCKFVDIIDINKKIPVHFFNTMKNLKFLSLSNNDFNIQKEFFSLKGLKCLIHLDLQRCQLYELPCDIDTLQCLTHLDLNYCESLEILPKNIGNLTSLTFLNLRGCKFLQNLPESISNLTSLTELVLRGCELLQNLPESIGNLTSLTKLDLKDCKSLQNLPESIGNLTSLTNWY